MAVDLFELDPTLRYLVTAERRPTMHQVRDVRTELQADSSRFEETLARAERALPAGWTVKPLHSPIEERRFRFYPADAEGLMARVPADAVTVCTVETIKGKAFLVASSEFDRVAPTGEIPWGADPPIRERSPAEQLLRDWVTGQGEFAGDEAERWRAAGAAAGKAMAERYNAALEEVLTRDVEPSAEHEEPRLRRFLAPIKPTQTAAGLILAMYSLVEHIPCGARIDDVEWSELHETFVAYVLCDQFEPVPWGAEIPWDERPDAEAVAAAIVRERGRCESFVRLDGRLQQVLNCEDLEAEWEPGGCVTLIDDERAAIEDALFAVADRGDSGLAYFDPETGAMVVGGVRVPEVLPPHVFEVVEKTARPCSCSIETLLARGCQCGGA